MNNKMVVDVSVVIPCYRCARTIYTAIESVWAQTVLPHEIILVEDCSEDNGSTIMTIDLIRRDYPEEWIKVFQNSHNQGPGFSRNLGWEKSSGDFVAFLDADDKWHPQKIEIQRQFMQKYELDISGHSMCNTGDELYYDYDINDCGLKRIKLKKLLFKNEFVTSTVMIRRKIGQRFNSQKYRSEDYLLWIEIIACGYNGAIIKNKLGYRSKNNPNSLSSNLIEMERGELDTFSVLRKRGFINFRWYLLCTVFSYLKFMFRLFKHEISIKK